MTVTYDGDARDRQGGVLTGGRRSADAEQQSKEGPHERAACQRSEGRGGGNGGPPAAQGGAHEGARGEVSAAILTSRARSHPVSACSGGLCSTVFFGVRIVSWYVHEALKVGLEVGSYGFHYLGFRIRVQFVASTHRIPSASL